MEFVKFCILALSIYTLFESTHGSIGGYINPADRNKFIQILQKSLDIDGSDLTPYYYAAKARSILNSPYEPQQVTDYCNNIKSKFQYQSIENSFYVYSAWKLLGCRGQIHTTEAVKAIQSAIENPKAAIPDIRYGLEILVIVGQQVSNPAKIAQTIQTKLKEDDSLSNLGHALHAGYLLGDSGKFVSSRVEDIIVQADEVDGKLLQWEGGLTTTSLLLTGLLRAPGSAPLTASQSDKFANYLLTRKTVQTPKGVLGLVEAANALQHSTVPPVSVSIKGIPQVSPEKGDLVFQITSIFGVPLKVPPKPIQVESVTKLSDNSVVVSNQALKQGGSSIDYVLPLKLDPGLYKVVISAGPNTADFAVRALGSLAIKSLEIGLSDTDGSAATKLTKLPYRNKLEKPLQADSSQNLIVKFSLSRPVHQAFLRLHSVAKEIIFVAEQDSSKVYLVEVNLEKELSESGNFEMELLLGDALITNPIRWNLGKIEVSLGAIAGKEAPRVARGPKREIEHLFRPAEKRPPEVVSVFFTALTASPFLILLILWAKIGINFENFTAISLPFHLGFGGILGLFTLFWLRLDMFVTCAWLVPIGGFTFFSGHKLLSHLARSRKQEKSDK
ncbi:unnamed protein product [Phyllotreta striolata]|uniref:Dolichyl-diphosphooligosaccharide--protein glycosyltransferase subunit 2 n=1 Tax=Phyllotreta striolata TaxID=444603 RepID=A0A9N9TEZ0_PHYSR|nr:unnamed protein product [Phyllotreta striolata]